MTQAVQIAIDGPAGAGKSSIAKALAKKLNYIYLDTGAMYRAVTWYALQQGIAVEDEATIKTILPQIHIAFHDGADGTKRLLCNDTDITEAIRTTEVSNNVSAIAMQEAVRAAMVEQQRSIASNQSVIMDGRDIGTMVLPDATYKFFLTASIEERARRRYKEMVEKGKEVDFEVLKEEIAERDRKDSTRAVSPLRQAEDAELIDTSDLSFDEVLALLLQKLGKQE